MFFAKYKTLHDDILPHVGRRMEYLIATLNNYRARPGLLYAAGSCFFFATSSVLVHVVDEIQAIQAVFYRSLVQLIFTVPMLIYHGVNPLPERENLYQTCLLVLRGAAGSSALCFQFYAFQHMPLPDATVLIFASPIFTGILAFCFLGEKWNKADAVSTALCFLGVLLIAQPTNFLVSSFESWSHSVYSLVAITGAILTSVSIILVKQARGVHCLMPSFYLALVGSLGTGLLCLYPGALREVTCGHQFLIVLIGLCAIGKCSQYLPFLKCLIFVLVFL